MNTTNKKIKSTYWASAFTVLAVLAIAAPLQAQDDAVNVVVKVLKLTDFMPQGVFPGGG